jgi:poly-gamma-glutamate synthesis protein (capsule biosynthesis protein)
MNIIISGDLLPTPNNEKLFCSGNVEALAGKDILDIYQNADFRISNLEGPLTDAKTPLEKSGPNIKGSIASVRGLKALGVDCVSIANNHILDYGEQGLEDTLRTLEENNIAHVGAGKNLSQARKPYITERGGIRLGIYSCAEYEFTIATASRGGANPFDALEIADEIRNLRAQCDILIVLYHGGKEFYRYPVPYVQKRCRKMADAGADFILCQHSHCIGAYEKYNDCGILYGQGNFIFCRRDDEYRRTGLLVRIVVENGRKETEFIPVVRHAERVRMAAASEKEEIMTAFRARSEEIRDERFVADQYRKFAVVLTKKYYSQSLGIFGDVLKLFRLEDIAVIFFAKRHRLKILNTIRCEAHEDVFREGLEAGLRK